VGQIIAVLAEEGDNISNIEVPKQQAAPPKPKQEVSSQSPAVDTSIQPTPQPSESPTLLSHAPSHARPIFPSVHRLLLENNISDPGKIPGTGVRGMITKGDVLTFLGKASGPNGTFKLSPSPIEEATKHLQKKEEVKVCKFSVSGHLLSNLSRED
jgi:pyruvate/2-oxoglutarate dehydrogenase complex dihydrolipoamide acyltransferase (E2) component